MYPFFNSLPWRRSKIPSLHLDRNVTEMYLSKHWLEAENIIPNMSLILLPLSPFVIRDAPLTASWSNLVQIHTIYLWFSKRMHASSSIVCFVKNAKKYTRSILHWRLKTIMYIFPLNARWAEKRCSVFDLESREKEFIIRSHETIYQDSIEDFSL